MQSGDSVLLAGEMGAGKTTLAQAIIKQYLPEEHEITSPTYALQHVYHIGDGGCLVHMDLYRIEHESELDALGLNEWMGVHRCIIEWPEKLGYYTPRSYMYVHLQREESSRHVAVIGSNAENNLFFDEVCDAIGRSGTFNVSA